MEINETWVRPQWDFQSGIACVKCQLPSLVFGFPLRPRHSEPTPISTSLAISNPWLPPQILPPLPFVAYRRRKNGTSAKLPSSQVCSFHPGTLVDTHVFIGITGQDGSYLFVSGFSSCDFHHCSFLYSPGQSYCSTRGMRCMASFAARLVSTRRVSIISSTMCTSVRFSPPKPPFRTLNHATKQAKTNSCSTTETYLIVPTSYMSSRKSNPPKSTTSVHNRT